MILLDTNVISELMKEEASPIVRTWLDEQVFDTLYLSVFTVSELHYGIFVLPDGKKKTQLQHALANILPLFSGRILPFDEQCALCYAQLAVAARQSGKGFPLPDAYIAAIAAAHDFAVASRDIAPYDAVKIQVINPWEAKYH
ncbi:type II toxin-antitoxin system VapC family toxin [Stenoxybacter acetivorans]|uniref:type II toxin-antitoxin system VapC family toxin n=1 Tax=Stenoxybacter acetivorans TaxID=422441 RepID=UPI000564CF9B|nr:type II toxin-antitoxin system VapC family toxin [Stenoxybacter acetivorans]